MIWISPARILLGALAISASFGFFYQNRATQSDAKQYPAPGKMLEVGGLKYHLNCMGDGTPTVILEAGLGESSLSWFPIQSEIAKTTRVCAYDRAGLGWSEGIDQQFSIDEVAIALHQLLNKNKTKPPYLLVGHSRGGIYVRSFYAQFSEDVVGMVLLDSTHEQGAAREYAQNRTSYLQQKVQILIAYPLSRLGLIRMMGWADSDRHPSPLPENILAAKSAVQNRTATARAIVNEIKVMREGLHPETLPPPSLNQLPLLVITSGKIDDEALSEEEKGAKLKRALQNELLALSSNSRHIIARKSGHFIMYDEPKLVVSEIENLIDTISEQVRGKDSPWQNGTILKERF